MTSADGPSRLWFVDRREGSWWVVADEAGGVIELPDWLMPERTVEGDVLEIDAREQGDRRVLEIRRSTSRTEGARRQAAELLDRLRSRRGEEG